MNEQSMARDKQRVTLAKWFIFFFAIWIGFLATLMVCGVSLEPLLDFGLGAVTGAMVIILGNIYQFFFRTSGDKKEKDGTVN